MATYEQMIEGLANWYEGEKEWGDDGKTSNGYAHAIADMFGKSKNEVVKDMAKVLRARKDQ